MSTRGRRRAPARTDPWRRTILALSSVVVVCLVAVVAGAAVGDASDPARVEGRTVVPATAASAPSTAVVAAAGVRTGAVDPESPRSVRLPGGTPVPVRSVGTTREGTLDVPADIDVAGWWRGGSRLGDPFGSVLIAAHVDSTTQGLGPFAELLSVRAGQSVVVTSEHLSQEYVISELRLVDKGALSQHAWVYSPGGPHRLTLVTCAGPFVPDLGGYQRLAVVTATAVGAPRPREQ